MKHLSELDIAVIGLGYVGLPLAVEFGRKRKTIGFDINKKRISDLKTGVDKTLEITKEELEEVSHLEFTFDENRLQDFNCFVITVPTPINSSKQPDLSYIEEASRLVGKYLKNSSIVIFESTVYPGCTEEICVPILEEISGLKYLSDDTPNKLGFYCGYSPERINPGDKEHRLVNIKKVTSGSTPEVAQLIDDLYSEIILSGTFMASSIAVAEAAKVIENSQRDLNIAFMNELSIIFNKLGIDTQEVIEAASTKWNFLPFSPGLVGGHCIGVDPYYLTHKAELMGHKPEVILAGRAINDSMGVYIVEKIIEKLETQKISSEGLKVLILGLTFKENCPDIRNTKVIDIYNTLSSLNINPDVYDPWVDPVEVKAIYGVECLDLKDIQNEYNVVILATPHKEFVLNWNKFKLFLNKDSLVFDLKACLPKKESDFRL